MKKTRQFRYPWDRVSNWCTGNDSLYYMLERVAREDWAVCDQEEFRQVEMDEVGYSYSVKLEGQKFVVTFTWEEEDAEA